MTRKGTIGILAALVAGGAALYLVARPATSRAGAAAASPVRTPAALVAPATVEAVDQRVDLAFEQAGRVVEILVHEGDRVEKGQLVARLDDRIARARVHRAEAALAAAEARRDLARHGARPEDIRAARADAQAARAVLGERTLANERTARLVQQKVVSIADADNARFAADAAAAQAAAADARKDVLERGTREEDKRESVAQAAIATAELEEARVLLSQTELRAPQAGTILRRAIEPGTEVGLMPPTVVLSLADVDRIQLRAEVDETDVAGIAPGQRGYATAETFGAARIAGRVERAMAELGRKRIVTDDPRARIDTRVLEVLFIPDEPHRPLPLGLRMDVHLDAAPARSVASR
jgi:HlyD family secretion protein